MLQVKWSEWEDLLHDESVHRVHLYTRQHWESDWKVMNRDTTNDLQRSVNICEKKLRFEQSRPWKVDH